ITEITSEELHKVPKELKVPEELKAPRELKVHKEYQALRELKVHKDLKVSEGPQASMYFQYPITSRDFESPKGVKLPK
ncbi:unnamed protein product, partial [Aphanomyces euteiches]